MCDVGFALSAASRHHQKLNRIRLQKFIYLLDVVGYLYEVLPPRKSHVTYKHGPFDAAIQNAVDVLVFRGFAKASNVQRDSAGKIHAAYELTPEGSSWVRKVAEDNRFSIRWDAAVEVADKVNSLGWERLVALVYAEPTFVNTKSQGYGQKLELNNGLENSAALLLETINRGLSHGFETTSPNRELIVELFFRYLDNYSRAEQSRSTTSQRKAGGET
jgi:DNA-binding PadR family transcriptional regulator